jgi:two-component system LytT family response regulator
LKKSLRAIIVDDEQDSRETLKHYVAKYCVDVEVVEMAENIAEAQKAIGKIHPDIVFLDVEMPFGSGFDLLDNLEKIDFDVIFVTAFSEYAMDAIRWSAASYLLKPVNIDDLVTAVDKVKENRKADNPIDHTGILLENIREINAQKKKVVLPTMEGFDVVRVSDVMYCSAADNFTSFHFTNGKKALICRSMKHYEKLLTNLGFQRIHRSYLINLEYVSQYRKGKGGIVIMENGDELDVAQSRKSAFLIRFKI